MGIVDAENADALIDPVQHNAPQLFPQLMAFFGLEIERIDVLILLRRVLRILHRAIGANAKPVLMFLHVGMVGRTLIGQVESYFEP